MKGRVVYTKDSPDELSIRAYLDEVGMSGYTLTPEDIQKMREIRKKLGKDNGTRRRNRR